MEIRQKRITAFVGPNGTGKSSVLQAFGLLKQTVEFPRRSPALFMQGPLANLPGMDAITDHGVAANPTFKFRVSDPLPESRIPFEYRTEFSAEQKPVLPLATESGLAQMLKDLKVVPTQRGFTQPFHKLEDGLDNDISLQSDLAQKEAQAATNLAYTPAQEEQVSRMFKKSPASN